MSKGTSTCGWCMTGNHASCKPKLEYYDKVWYCECNTCKQKVKSDDASDPETPETLPVEE